MKRLKLLILSLVLLIIGISSTIFFSDKNFDNKFNNYIGNTKKEENREKLNIIYIIGDGMGFANIEAAEIYVGYKLEITNTDNIFSITTYSNNNKLTDSAAAGTALATGVKTNNGVIGLDPKGNKIPNILEIARSNKMKIGIVTTDIITGATPASFSAHAKSRKLNKEIEMDQIIFKPNILYGGYDKAYTMFEINRSNYKYITKQSELKKLTKQDEYVLGLFNVNDLKNITNKNNTPTLVEMTESAIKQLENNNNGFFLVIEEAHIDQAAHKNDFKLMVNHQLQMDELVKYMKDYVKDNPNTLVIITADHETGGIVITDELEKGKIPKKIFTTKNHVKNDVPLIVFGKKSELFFKNMDNTDIFKILKSIIS